MGMSTHIKAFIPDTDPEFQRHKIVAEICMEHKVSLPAETSNYFNVRHNPSPGMFDEKLSVELTNGIHYTEYNDSHDAEAGFEVDLTKLPKGVTKLRFYNSW
jgi:hypothetical protein